MEQRPMVMNVGNMVGATERAKARVQSWIDLALEVSTDARGKERLAAQECKACFYAGRIGGAAITNRPCMACGETQTYGSTNTDVLCRPCASGGQLCKHCGGDVELRARRRTWPQVYSESATANPDPRN